MLYLTIATLLTLAHLGYGLPKNTAREVHNYPRYSESDRQRFSAKSPSPFTSTIEDEDTHPAATQQQPNYPYVYQNAIPIKQKVQVVARGPQQFANQREGPPPKGVKRFFLPKYFS